MALSDHVSITITVDTVGIARSSYGVAGFLSHNATFAERVRTYASLAEVAEDFADTDSPEYLCAQSYFGQSPHPTKLKILRAGLKPTLSYTLDVVTVRDSHDYEILVKGQGVTETTVSYTSDSSASEAEIVAGLVSALNAVVGKNFTATDNTTSIDVTASAAGEWFSLEIIDRTDLSAVIDHADPGVATDLAAIVLEDAEWYELLTAYNSSAYVLAAAAWVESAGKKRYRAICHDTTALTDTVGTGNDVLDDLKTQGYERTMGCYHPDPSEFFDSAWSGRVLCKDPGTIIEKFKSLSGISAVTMTSTERTNLINKRGNSYESAGLDITFEGFSAKAGRFFDTVRDRDALEDDVQASVMEALAGADKVEYSDPGVAVVEGAVRASLRRNTSSKGVNRILAATPAPEVSVPLVADVSDANKTARVLPDVRFNGTLGGGIHKVQLTGTVSL